MTLEKRTYDNRLFDIDCTDLLAPTETVSAVASVSADQGQMTFGDGSVNGSTVSYPDGTTAAAGKVIQVRISDGVVPPGVGALMCTVRAKFATNINPQLEATVQLRLTDLPG